MNTYTISLLHCSVSQWWTLKAKKAKFEIRAFMKSFWPTVFYISFEVGGHWPLWRATKKIKKWSRSTDKSRTLKKKKVLHVHIFSFQILSAVGKDTVEIVMKLVLNQFTEDMFVLPAPLCTLFKSLEQRCSSKGIKTPHYCVAVKVCYLFSLDVFTAAIAWDHWQDTHS